MLFNLMQKVEVRAGESFKRFTRASLGFRFISSFAISDSFWP
jgi:hypothetical protein